MKPIERTSAGLREALMQEMDALRNGKSTPNRASAFSKLAVQIINTITMEVEYQKHVASLSTDHTGERKTYSLSFNA